MRHHTFFVKLVLIVILFPAHTIHPKETEPKADKVIQIDPMQKFSYQLSDLVDSVSYIFLEKSEVPLRVVSKLEYVNDRLYILDVQTPKIDCYDKEGHFLFDIRDIGRGTGEFIKPIRFTVSGDKTQLVVGASALKKVLYYDMDGNYLRENYLNAYLDDLYTLDADHYLIYDYSPVNSEQEKRRYMFNVVSKDFEIVSRDVENFHGRHSFGLSTPYYVGNFVLTTFAFDYNIYSVERVGDTFELRPKYYIDFGDHKVEPSLIDEYGWITKENIKIHENLSSERLVYRIDHMGETEEFIFFLVGLGEDRTKEDYLKMIVYSKVSGNYCFINEAVNDINGFRFGSIRHSKDLNTFYVPLSSEQLYDKETDFYMKYKDKLEPGHNPILMTFKLKSF